MGNTTLVLLLVFALIGIGTSGCSKTGATDTQAINQSVASSNKGNFRLSLTDAPHPSLSHVFVNVDHVELLLEKDGDAGRLMMGQDMGTIDLLKLRDGVTLPIDQLNLKENVIVKQFRLVLKDSGNSIVRLADGSTCELKTPSQQQSGLKLIMPNGGIQIGADKDYSLVVDFDVDHSIVDNQNGCLLKPVLKVKSLSEVPKDEAGETEDNSDNNGGDTSTDPATDNTGTTGGDTSTPPATDTTAGDTTTDTSSGGTTDTSTSTDSSTGTASSTDTSMPTEVTYTGEGDAAPIVTESDVRFFVM